MRMLGTLLAAVLLGQDVWAGETAAFLKIAPGARPIGMGQAFTAAADDLNSLSWNPAGLSRIGQREAAFTHAELFADTQYDFAGYSQPIGGQTVAFGVSRLSQGRLAGRGEDRRPTGAFSAADTSYQVALSRPVSSIGGRWGVSGKLLESRIGGEAARGFAMDLGYQQALTLQGRPVTLGLAVMNMGPGIRYQQETSALPLTLSGGVAVPLLSTVLLSADYRHRPQSADSIGVGTEYTVMPALALRAGFSPAAATPDTAGLAGGQLGVGFGLKVGKARFDYSFMPAGILGNAQRLSLSTRF